MPCLLKLKSARYTGKYNLTTMKLIQSKKLTHNLTSKRMSGLPVFSTNRIKMIYENFVTCNHWTNGNHFSIIYGKRDRNMAAKLVVSSTVNDCIW